MKTMLAMAAALVAALLALDLVSTQMTAYSQDMNDRWSPENEQVETENEQVETENEQVETENEQVETEKELAETEKELAETEKELEMEVEDGQINNGLPSTTNLEFPSTDEQD
jgi:septal ring factor EnvC (AmiA/AmiB activator)